MKRSAHNDPSQTNDFGDGRTEVRPYGNTAEPALRFGELPNRLLTALKVAEFVGCHEETVRRAYLRGLLTSQRFGV